LVVASLAASAPSVDAATVGCADANACSLAELFNGGSLVVADKTFANWALDTSTLPAETLNNIFVAGIGADPLNPGLAYIGNGQLTVSGASTLQLGFHFTASVNAGSDLRIKDHSLVLVDATGVGTGTVAVDGTILDLALSALSAEHVDLATTADNGAFAQHAAVLVSDLITLASGDADSNASLNTLAQLFSQEPVTRVPEPGIVALVGIGLAGIGVLRRRGIRK